MAREHMVGVHNDTHNIDYYSDGTIEIFDQKKLEIITVFDESIVSLLMGSLKRDGELERLLKIERKRIEALPIKDEWKKQMLGD